MTKIDFQDLHSPYPTQILFYNDKVLLLEMLKTGTKLKIYLEKQIL